MDLGDQQNREIALLISFDWCYTRLCLLDGHSESGSQPTPGPIKLTIVFLLKVSDPANGNIYNPFSKK